MIVVDNHVVTQEQRGEVEAVVCYDAATGDEIWAHEDPVRFEEALRALARAARRLLRTAEIYTYSAKGNLNCLNRRDRCSAFGRTTARPTRRSRRPTCRSGAIRSRHWWSMAWSSCSPAARSDKSVLAYRRGRRQVGVDAPAASNRTARRSSSR